MTPPSKVPWPSAQSQVRFWHAMGMPLWWHHSQQQALPSYRANMCILEGPIPFNLCLNTQLQSHVIVTLTMDALQVLTGRRVCAPNQAAASARQSRL
jgi:hypothetical protein